MDKSGITADVSGSPASTSAALTSAMRPGTVRVWAV